MFDIRDHGGVFGGGQTGKYFLDTKNIFPNLTKLDTVTSTDFWQSYGTINSKCVLSDDLFAIGLRNNSGYSYIYIFNSNFEQLYVSPNLTTYNVSSMVYVEEQKRLYFLLGSSGTKTLYFYDLGVNLLPTSAYRSVTFTSGDTGNDGLLHYDKTQNILILHPSIGFTTINACIPNGTSTTLLWTKVVNTGYSRVVDGLIYTFRPYDTNASSTTYLTNASLYSYNVSGCTLITGPISYSSLTGSISTYYTGQDCLLYITDTKVILINAYSYPVIAVFDISTLQLISKTTISGDKAFTKFIGSFSFSNTDYNVIMPLDKILETYKSNLLITLFNSVALFIDIDTITVTGSKSFSAFTPTSVGDISTGKIIRLKNTLLNAFAIRKSSNSSLFSCYNAYFSLKS